MMADLSFIEKNKLEKLLDMGGGYVLDFSNRSFSEFVADSVQRDIYSDQYAHESGSKANRMRAFWNREPNHLVGKLIADLLDYCSQMDGARDEDQMAACRVIADRLQQGAPVADIEAINDQLGERAFEMLTQSVKQSIDENKPELGLDRLHTYVLKWMRCLCEKHEIDVPREKPLHSLVGEYVKYLKTEGRIESEMTERILKSSISTMEAFNHVRNERSLAHDNPILNYDESLLIFNHVASAIRFMSALERDKPNDAAANASSDTEIPF